MEATAVRHQASAYGILGLAPFVMFGAAYPLWPANVQQLVAEGFVLYGAIILAFMAGALWLPSLLNQQRLAREGLATAIFLSLVAFIAAMLPTPWSLLILSVGFIALLVAETKQLWMLLYPGWYWSMRIALTGVVLICHFLLALWILMD